MIDDDMTVWTFSELWKGLINNTVIYTIKTPLQVPLLPITVTNMELSFKFLNIVLYVSILAQ